MSDKPVATGRIALIAAIASLALLNLAGSSNALEGKCATCDVKTKEPSPNRPGQFRFTMACAFDITSEEKFFVVIAKDEDEARAKSQTEAPSDCW